MHRGVRSAVDRTGPRVALVRHATSPPGRHRPPAPGRIGLLGPNGAGKSTLLKILLGLLPPSSGSGRVLGQRPRPFDGIDLRRAVGYMPEADALVPGLRGAEYVALAGELYGMPPREAQRRAHEVLTYLELEDARYRRLEEYSTGMKQRLKLAQALVHDPPVLLLDEPTSGLDPSGRDAMLRLLLTLGREHGKSILLSTHLLGDVERVCETVLILHQGRRAAPGRRRGGADAPSGPLPPANSGRRGDVPGGAALEGVRVLARQWTGRAARGRAVRLGDAGLLRPGRQPRRPAARPAARRRGPGRTVPPRAGGDATRRKKAVMDDRLQPRPAAARIAPLPALEGDVPAAGRVRLADRPHRPARCCCAAGCSGCSTP